MLLGKDKRFYFIANTKEEYELINKFLSAKYIDRDSINPKLLRICSYYTFLTNETSTDYPLEMVLIKEMPYQLLTLQQLKQILLEVSLGLYKLE